MDNNRENSKILLSISLVVSNNRDTIRRTMESIKPLLSNINSECIVVDRNSNDGTMDIVREYSKNIIALADSSLLEARNAGLKLAQGQWILYLNENEWFEDCKEIINFFNSGKYLNFAYAIYFRRNLQNTKEGFYMDTAVAGACKIEENTHFEGDEQPKLSPLNLVSKQWQGFVYHEGFTFLSLEEESRYHKLYSAYLQKELKKKPDNLQNVLCLAEEYRIASECAKGAEICRVAIENYKWKWNSKEGNYLMWSLIRLLVEAGEHQNAWEEGWQILKICNPNTMTLVHINILLIKVAQELGGYEKEVLKLALDYRQNMEYLYNHADEQQETEMLFMTFSEAKRFEKMVALTGVMAACRLQAYESLTVFLPTLSWEDAKETAVIMEEYKRAFPEAVSALTAAMSQIEIPTAYLCLQRLLFSAENCDTNLQSQFNICIDQCYIEKIYYPQVLTVGLTASLDFIELFAILDQDDWEAWIRGAGNSFTTTEYIKIGQIVEKCLSTKNRIQYTAFLLVVQKYMILQESIVKDPDFLLDLEQFCDNVQHYFTLVYQESMFRPENQLNLPRMCRFALHMNKAFSARKAKDYKRAILGLKDALSENIALKDVVDGALLLIQEEMVENDKLIGKERLQGEEFSVLEQQIKERVKQLIALGKLTEALQMIGPLETLLPNDSEVKALREQTEAFLEQTEAFPEQTEAFPKQAEAFPEQTEAFPEQIGDFLEQAEAFLEHSEGFPE